MKSLFFARYQFLAKFMLQLFQYFIKGWVRSLYLTPLSTILQLYRGGQFIRRKPKYPEKITDLRQVTDKLYHKMLYRIHLVLSGIRIPNVIGDMYWLNSITSNFMLNFVFYQYLWNTVWRCYLTYNEIIFTRYQFLAKLIRVKM
jgi:hypothetical protein